MTRRVIADMRRIAIALLAVGLVLLSPVLIPLAITAAAVSHGFFLRRLRAAASQFACLTCGAVLGREAIRLADAAWAEHMRGIFARGVRPRVIRDLHAICPRCAAEYWFVEGENVFVARRTGGGQT